MHTFVHFYLQKMFISISNLKSIVNDQNDTTEKVEKINTFKKKFIVLSKKAIGHLMIFSKIIVIAI